MPVAMALMTGTYTKQFDRKGRVSVPAALRNLLLPENATEFKVRPVPDELALEALTLGELEEQYSIIKTRLAIGSEEWDDAIEEYISSAKSVTPDAEGRIILPPDFREHIGETEEVTFVGRGTTMRIWAADAYTAFKAKPRSGKRKPLPTAGEVGA